MSLEDESVRVREQPLKIDRKTVQIKHGRMYGGRKQREWAIIFEERVNNKKREINEIWTR